MVTFPCMSLSSVSLHSRLVTSPLPPPLWFPGFPPRCCSAWSEVLRLRKAFCPFAFPSQVSLPSDHARVQFCCPQSPCLCLFLTGACFRGPSLNSHAGFFSLPSPLSAPPSGDLLFCLLRFSPLQTSPRRHPSPFFLPPLFPKFTGRPSCSRSSGLALFFFTCLP